MNLVYALDEEGKNKLISLGFNFINEQKLNNKVVYIFENKPDKIYTFSAEDKKRFLFTNMMYF